MQAQSRRSSCISIASTLLLLSVTAELAKCLSINSIEVPAAVMNASQVTLVCNYDLQGDQLYSVKWYKNYVEFYRFQPPPSVGQLDPAQDELIAHEPNYQQYNQSQDNLTINSKHDFELDGINLNLSKSNASHVYLRQVTLTSEGTYKCEVTADTPTFPTVKIERQMKVYALPKQRLYIVDNSPAKVSFSAASTASPSGRGETGHHQERQRQTGQGVQQGTMRTSQIYNLNDTINITCISVPSKPAAKLTWLLNGSPITSAGKWINYHERSTSDQLVGSKSTLTFKIPTNQLRLMKNSTLDLAPSGLSPKSRFQVLRLQCIAGLSLEYSAETSIQAAGGKTIVKRRRQQQLQVTDPMLPSPDPLQSTGQRSNNESSASRVTHQTVGDNSRSSIYLWPPSPSGNGNMQRSLSGWRRGNISTVSDSWVTSAGRNNGGSDPAPRAGELQSHEDSSIARRRFNSASHNGLITWTYRELKAQAEHIDFIIRSMRPNELEAPTIEAKIQQLEDDSNIENIATNSDDTDETRRDERYEPSSVIKDYELNDLVRFICLPQFGNKLAANKVSNEFGVTTIRVKWYINNIEITTNRVNAFDGTRFYYVQNRYPARRARLMPVDPTSSKISANSDTLLAVDNKFNITSNASTTEQSKDFRSITIDFTPQLLQLNELNLKCHSSIEQTLIEYSSQFAVSAHMSLADTDRFWGSESGYTNVGRALNNNSRSQEKNRFAATPNSTPSSASLNLLPYLLILLITCYLARLIAEE